jgi:hypothetical protein
VHRQSRDEWVATIQKMIVAGAEGSEDQFTAVLSYLSKNFGPAVPERPRALSSSAAEA